MNVKDYRYVIEIARQESVSQAADVLCITQSALTKFLQRTERELGIALFSGKQPSLSDRGGTVLCGEGPGNRASGR